MAHTYRDIPGAGTSLQLSITSTLTTIPGCHEITWDGTGVAERNPTALDSGHVRKKPGLPNFGEVKFKVWFDPNDATHQALLTKITGATPTASLDSWKLIYADGFTTPANITFTGFLKEFNLSGIEPETGTVIREGTIAVDSITAVTAGAPTE